jgi:hypothetical protein
MLLAKLEEWNEVRLVRLPAIVREPPPNRTLWASEEVFYEVQPPFGENYSEQRRAYFRDALDAFTNHYRINVAENPFNKASDAMLARVDPVRAEFWDIRAIDPPQGIRCFGAFADHNVFVALTWDYRENITDFGDAVAACVSLWSDLFGPISPHSGDSLDAYLSNYKSV